MGYPFDEDEDSGDNGNELGSVVNPSNINLSNIDFSNLGSGFAGDIGNIGITPDFLSQLLNNPELLRAFQAEFPEDYKVLQGILSSNTGTGAEGAGFLGENVKSGVEEWDDAAKKVGINLTDPTKTGAEGAGFPGENVKSGVEEWDDAAKKAGVNLTDPNASTGLKKILEEISKAIKDATGVSGTDLTKGLLAAYLAKKAYEEGQEARNYRRGATMGINAPVTTTRNAFQGTKYSAAGGGIGSLDMTQGRYLGGTTDGMADKIPAHIDRKRPAALSDGEFVIPADVVSHLGNGNSSAGAKRLYEMMDRIRHARTGNPRQGKQINPNKFLPR